MKMNKILAAGVAATLAVTSLSAVAGATVERSFDLKSTKGSVTYAAGAKVVEGYRAASKEFEVIRGTGDDASKVVASSYFDSEAITETSNKLDTNWDKSLSAADWDAFIPVKIESTAGKNLLNLVGDFSVTVNGRANDNGNLVSTTQVAKLVKIPDGVSVGVDGATHVLPIYKTTAPANADNTAALMPGKFVAIDTITLNTSASGVTYTVNGIGSEDLYTDIVNNGRTLKVANSTTVSIKDSNGNNAIQAWASDDLTDTASEGTDVKLTLTLPGYTKKAGYNELTGKIEDADGGQTSVIAYNITAVSATGNYTVTPITVADYSIANKDKSNRAALLLNEICNMISQGTSIVWAKSANSTAEYSPVLVKTEINGDAELRRNEIWELSTTRDYNSTWGAHVGTNGASDELAGVGQTYNIVDYNKGTHANDFAGLASQVADFFNKQLNGKIIFTFAPVAASTSSSGWISEGIPSTEVGLKTVLSEMSYQDFALFVNYGSTTGSLQAIAALDLESGSVEFDISDILVALGGQTIGTVQDIYYGLRTGIANCDGNGTTGLVVSKVTLQYDETATVSGDTAAADDKETVKEEEPAKEEPKNEDKADTVEIPDDADDGDDTDVVIDEPDTADTTVDNTADNTTPVVITNPTNTAADENPHTGAALAVVPAIVAAAAMALSKKRK